MNWIVRRIKILFDSRLTKTELHKIDHRVIVAAYSVKDDPEQLKLLRRLVEMLETK